MVKTTSVTCVGSVIAITDIGKSSSIKNCLPGVISPRLKPVSTLTNSYRRILESSPVGDRDNEGD